MRINSASSFDGDGQRFAQLSSDGKIKLWDTSTGDLKQEFTPALRSDSSCTCLCWSTSKATKDHGRQRKRKRQSTVPPEEKLFLGATSGIIHCFDPVTAELENLPEETLYHGGRINSICASSQQSSLYTCGEDKFIMRWTSSPVGFKSKWKVGKQAATVLVLSSDGTHLLSAGRTIKLWCLETEGLLQRFAGHISPVTMMQFSGLKSLDADKASAIDGCYFLSWSSEENHVNAWHVNRSNPEKHSVATFSLTGHPVGLDCWTSDDRSQPFRVVAAGSDGVLNVYSHTLNGKMRKPLKASHVVSFVNKEEATRSSSDNVNEDSDRIPMIGVRFAQDSADDSLMVVYGNSWNPQFEFLSTSKLEKQVTLHRKISSALVINEDETTDETKAKKVKGSHVLSSAPLPTSGLAGDAGNLSKTGDQLSMEERLNASMMVAAASKQSAKQKRPNMASLTQILVQGLQSQDDMLIESVIRRGNREYIVKATLQKFPSVLVIPLLKMLVDKIMLRPGRASVLSNWIKMALSMHMTYLLSTRQLISSLGGLYQLLESRTSVYEKLTNLHGRLDLLLSQAKPKQSQKSISDNLHTPAATLQDGESTDDEQNVDEMLQRTEGTVESEDEWDVMEEEEEDEESKSILGLSGSDDEGNESGGDDFSEDDIEDDEPGDQDDADSDAS